LAGLPRAIVTFFMTTSVTGFSPRADARDLADQRHGLALAEDRVAAVERRLGPSVMKNCEPFVSRPALAMASTPACRRAGWVALVLNL
jgi:hypothetical protein